MMIKVCNEARRSVSKNLVAQKVNLTIDGCK